jgi:hypothetical protein
VVPGSLRPPPLAFEPSMRGALRDCGPKLGPIGEGRRAERVRALERTRRCSRLRRARRFRRGMRSETRWRPSTAGCALLCARTTRAGAR